MAAASTSQKPHRSAIGRRPAADPASAWVHHDDTSGPTSRGTVHTARLTLDVTPALRARIKIAAFGQGVTVAELLRGLLEREFPEHRRENTP